MKLTDYILALMVKGELSKEAGIAALSLNKNDTVKLADGSHVQMPGAVAPTSMEDLAKYIGIQIAVSKGLDVAGGLIGKMTDKMTKGKNDGLFQQLLSTHPAMSGKDPARAKANFDYLLAESPHLSDHPLILGDHVANMTSMGTSDLATTKTIADITKARSDVASKKNPMFPMSAQIGDMAGKMYLAGNAPPPPSGEQIVDQLATDEVRRLHGKALGQYRAGTNVPDELLQTPAGQTVFENVMRSASSAKSSNGKGSK